MTHPHPWRRLARYQHVVVVWVPMVGRIGASDGNTIWLHPAQTQAQRRCTLTHELEHVARGHRGCQSPAVEAEVREAAARWLLPRLDLVVDSLTWSGGRIDEAAEELWVDADTLVTRIGTLTSREREWALRRHE